MTFSSKSDIKIIINFAFDRPKKQSKKRSAGRSVGQLPKRSKLANSIIESTDTFSEESLDRFSITSIQSEFDQSESESEKISASEIVEENEIISD